MTTRVMVIGRQAGQSPEGLPESETGAEYVFADTHEAVVADLAGCDVVFHYGDPHDALSANWDLTKRLRWLHVGGVGVDWALFPALVESDVILTNCRGVFDTSLPEHLLSLMLAQLKELPVTFAAQQRHVWQKRVLRPLAGSRAVIVGAGSIARGAARLLGALGVTVSLVGRSARHDPVFGPIHAITELDGLLPATDWLIVLAPLTPETRGLIGATELARLPSSARLVNFGRGPTVDQAALVEALREGRLAGAVLDVFEKEPLPAQSPLWEMPNVIVSPHIGGDEWDTLGLMAEIFRSNLRRYLAGQPLENVVDKRLGYVRSSGD
jgi:phosphoglycerate dehydrogenase-like enzyme